MDTRMESSWKGRDMGGWNPRGKDGTGEDGMFVERGNKKFAR